MHKAFLGVEPAILEWREIIKQDETYFAPYSPHFDDIYFNTLDGIAESEYVFIEGNNLKERFLHRPNEFSVFETGFGSGLNFLLTANLWQQTNPHGHLNYYSVEQFPISVVDLKRIYKELKLESDFVEPLINGYPPILPGIFPIQIAKNITLHLIYYPLDQALKEIALNDKQKIDAWFLDGFAPSKNPTMWHKGLWHFIALKAINTPKRITSIATFTAASEVRKMLQHYGFDVNKRKGFGYKREMLTAQFKEKQLSTPKPNLASSFIETRPKPKKVAVIGAGLAGCSLAYKLHQQDVEVHIFEKAGSVAAGASKMPALLAMPNVSIDHNSYSQLTFSGFKIINDFLNKNAHLKHSENSIQLESDKYSKHQLEQYLSIYQDRVDIKAAGKSSLYDFAVNVAAVQVSGPDLCKAFLRNIPEAKIHLGSKKESFEQLKDFDHIIIATGYSELAKTLNIPEVMPLRGQVTSIIALEELPNPINYDGHLFQTTDRWVLGATFENSSDDGIRLEDDKFNIELANSQFGFNIKESNIIKSFAGIRASSFDRFPFCGKYSEQNGQTIWLNYGYGTRGLCLSLLGAEIISNSIANRAMPVSKTLLQRLSPLR